MPENAVFFDAMSEQSKIKTEIVTDYFTAWTGVIKKWNCNIGYVDLFCGPGKYENGYDSSPVIIIHKVLKDSILSSKIQFLFNDGDKHNIDILKNNIAEIDPLGVLNNRIQYYTETIGNDFGLRLKIPQNMPILSFVDPFGYKGITMQLINKLVANTGSDCIFFFNYNRVNMAINNNKFDEHVMGIFGKKRTIDLKEHLLNITPYQREGMILRALTESLRENQIEYVLPFKFYSTEKLRTSHFIIFVSKHSTACKIMKRIMYQHSAKDADGIAKYTFEDSYNFVQGTEQISFDRPFIRLKDQLFNDYHGRTARVGDICDQFDRSFSTPYVGENIKEALKQMEKSNQIIVLSGRKIKMTKGRLNMPDAATVQFV